MMSYVQVDKILLPHCTKSCLNIKLENTMQYTITAKVKSSSVDLMLVMRLSHKTSWHIISSRWHALSVSIKIVMQPLSTMGENAFTLESMASYHYPPRVQDKTRTKVLC